MFKNREEAGKLLAERLKKEKLPQDSLIFAIPRGGVVVGEIVSELLVLKLVSLIVRKIGAPGNPELAIGSVGPENTVYWDEDLCRSLRITRSQKSKLKSQKFEEQKERGKKFLKGRIPNIKGKTIVVVDDGVATGATAIVGSLALRKIGAAHVFLAVPVIARDTVDKLKRYYDKLIYLDAPLEFHAVGQFYQDFPQVEDKEVIEILKSR